MPMHERSGKVMGGSGKAVGEKHLLGSGRPPRRVVAIFDQESERIDSGNGPTGLRGLLVDFVSVVRRTL